MNAHTRTQLEIILERGSDFYRETARQLLAGELVWSSEDIDQFLDGFLNDPYLTRNN